MFDVPVESTYVWAGLAAVGTAMLGLAVQVPAAPPPDATPVARTVDSVASSPYEASARQPIDAAEISLGSERVGLRGPGGTGHATFAYDGVVPAAGSDGLRAVLQGRPPSRVFDDPAAFETAIDRARARNASWRSAPERLLVRRVTWEGVHATLVG